MLPKIKSSGTLVGKTYELIKKKIINNEFSPGDRLIEEDIASQMGISRTPIRSALTQLSYEGLVNMEVGKRTYVSKISKNDIKDFQIIRQHLEVLSSELAVYEVTKEELLELERIILEQEKSINQRDFKSFVELDVLFHKQIALSSNNERLYEFIENLNVQLQRYLILTGILHEIASSSLEEHRNILNAFKAKDVKRAKQFMLDHIKIF